METSSTHIFRINVSGKGYTLLCGDPDTGFLEQPLDIPSPIVPRGYFSAQRRLDGIIANKKNRWSVTFRFDTARGKPIVAYGGFIEVPDDHGRLGITFIHALELKTPYLIAPYIYGICKILSNKPLQRRCELIAEVAIGRTPLKNLIDHSLQISEDELFLIERDLVDRNLGLLGSVHNIEHDCAGASSLAWLMMAEMQSRQSPPWEVYDTNMDNGNVATIATNASVTKSKLLSEILCDSYMTYCQKINSPSISREIPEHLLQIKEDYTPQPVKMTHESNSQSIGIYGQYITTYSESIRLNKKNMVTNISQKARPLILTFDYTRSFDCNFDDITMIEENLDEFIISIRPKNFLKRVVRISRSIIAIIPKRIFTEEGITDFTHDIQKNLISKTINTSTILHLHRNREGKAMRTVAYKPTKSRVRSILFRLLILALLTLLLMYIVRYLYWR